MYVKVKNLSLRLRKFLPADSVLINESLARHTAFKIGGNCLLLVKPTTIKQIVKIIKILRLRGFKFFIIGNGTNLLVTDKGLNAVVIKLSNQFASAKVEGNVITAQAGASLTVINKLAVKHMLSGLEFSYGIPGTLGGAVVQNAGAYGGEIKDCLKSVTVYNGKRVKKIKAKKLGFGYRKSIFKRKTNYVILEVSLNLNFGNTYLIKERLTKCLTKRKTLQPYELPNAGSIFKRHKKLVTSRAIDELGLKGYQIGKAQISTKHSGFIVNLGGASYSDVFEIIEYIKKEIYIHYKVKLRLEIQTIGE